jgi:hypothetical protein
LSSKRPASTTKKTPVMPSPGGKVTKKTTDQLTMAQFKKYLDYHEKKKGTGGKVIGKRSAGGPSSGKSTEKGSKRSKK